MFYDKINPDKKGTKFDADAYAEKWSKANEKRKRYFDADNPMDSANNFINDLKKHGLAKESDDGEITWTKAFDSSAKAAKESATSKPNNPLPCGCPGSQAKAIVRNENTCDVTQAQISSQLRQWPVQIKLVPTQAPYYENANLLVAADCSAYAYGNFHNEFIRNSITLIGCPKLDEGDYTQKLTEIIKNNNIKSVTVTRMEVPCCGGIENAVKSALQASGKFIPWKVVIISTDGQILQ